MSTRPERRTAASAGAAHATYVDTPSLGLHKAMSQPTSLRSTA